MGKRKVGKAGRTERRFRGRERKGTKIWKENRERRSAGIKEGREMGRTEGRIRGERGEERKLRKKAKRKEIKERMQERK